MEEGDVLRKAGKTHVDRCDTGGELAE